MRGLVYYVEAAKIIWEGFRVLVFSKFKCRRNWWVCFLTWVALIYNLLKPHHWERIEVETESD